MMLTVHDHLNGSFDNPEMYNQPQIFNVSANDKQEFKVSQLIGGKESFVKSEESDDNLVNLFGSENTPYVAKILHKKAKPSGGQIRFNIGASQKSDTELSRLS